MKFFSAIVVLAVSCFFGGLKSDEASQKVASSDKIIFQEVSENDLTRGSFPSTFVLQSLAEACNYLGNAVQKLQPKAVCHFLGTLLGLAAGVTAHKKAERMKEEEQEKLEEEQKRCIEDFINAVKSCEQVFNENATRSDDKEIVVKKTKLEVNDLRSAFSSLRNNVIPSMFAFLEKEVEKKKHDTKSFTSILEATEKAAGKTVEKAKETTKEAWDYIVETFSAKEGLIPYFKEKIVFMIDYLEKLLYANS
jgi:hypothetical protein